MIDADNKPVVLNLLYIAAVIEEEGPPSRPTFAFNNCESLGEPLNHPVP